MWSFEKIGSTQTLSAEIVEKISNEILSKNILPGEKLPAEKQLCEDFGVGRTSIREALQTLSAQGLIMIQKGKGVFVSDISSDQVNKALMMFFTRQYDDDWALNIIKARQIIEPNCAYLAALNSTEFEIDDLAEILKQFDACDDTNYEKWGELDKQFHMKISELSGNPVIPLLMDPIFELMPMMRANVYKVIDKANSSASEYHAKIFGAINNHNPNLAHDIMMEHLKVAEEHSGQIMKSKQILRRRKILL